jgi:S-DNA-T family DNA segregation ATPase FtsK/SpoIIIE
MLAVDVMSEQVQQRTQEGLGLLTLAVAAYVLLTLVTYSAADPSFSTATSASNVHNSGGMVGAYLADILIQFFGLAAFVLPIVLSVLGWQLLRHIAPSGLILRAATVPLLMVALASLMAIVQPMPEWPTVDGIGNGGLVGKLVALGLHRWVGLFGAIAFSFLLAFMAALWLSGLSLHDIYTASLHIKRFTWVLLKVIWRFMLRFKFKRAVQHDLPLPLAVKKRKQRKAPKVERKEKKAEAKKTEQAPLPLALDGNFQLPGLDLLDDNTQKFKPMSEDDLTQNARQIEAQLRNFNVEGTVTKVRPGPVITIYELEPAAGVKTSAIVGLSEDLARAMSATAIRIAPIPGRNVIGIEMPNLKRQMVTLKQLLETEPFETNPGKLAVAMGVDTGGEPVYSDIAKMPHALIAGTTGSGKSVAMNAFIMSLLYRLTPDELRFVMIDPKMLELSIYNDIPHLLTPVITDPNKAAGALKWVVGEMENRYQLMSALGVKNIQSFNAKFAELQAAGKTPTRMVQVGFEPTTGQPKMEEQPLAERTLPYIVVVIDELADLMMVAGKQVEVYIARLAQMARAAGIHLLVATQRPSVDVVTGLIKANIPTRISFSVTSKIDSRTVLDQMGAEQLLGKGDMLFMENGSNALQRLHGAFVTEEECTSVANFLKQQGEPAFIDMAKATAAAAAGGSAATAPNTNGEGESSDDPLYQQAIELVAREQKASTSFIQRHLKIGYNRAADIVEKLEADGLIGPADHVGKREVIVRKPPEGGY